MIKEKILKVKLSSGAFKTKEYSIKPEFEYLIIPPISCKTEIYVRWVTPKKGLINTDIKLHVVLKNRFGKEEVHDCSQDSHTTILNVKNFSSFYIIHGETDNRIKLKLFLEDKSYSFDKLVTRKSTKNGYSYCYIKSINNIAIADAIEIYETMRQSKRILLANKFTWRAIRLALSYGIVPIIEHTAFNTLICRRIFKHFNKGVIYLFSILS